MINKINNFVFESINFFKFYKKSRAQKKIIFYSESLFYKNYYVDLYTEVKKKIDGVIILTSDINEFNHFNNQNVEVYYIGKGLLRIIFFNFISCDLLIMTMPGLGNNLKKSPWCKKYLYYFHSLASTHVIYKSNAFDNFDILFTNGDYQIQEIRKNEKIFNLKKKELYNSGFLYLDYLKNNTNKNKNKKNCILLAPSWNYSIRNLFNDHVSSIIENLTKNDFYVILRPHPELIKRNKKKFDEIIKKFNKNNLFELDLKPSNIESMEKTSLLITDNSTISLEFSITFKRPILYIDHKKKIHNPNYEKINKLSFEDEYKNTIAYILDSSKINTLANLCKKIISESYFLDDKIIEIENKMLSNVGLTSKKASQLLLEIYKKIN